MELNNTLEKIGKISKESYGKFLRLLYPAAPHIASELWGMSGFDGMVSEQNWPSADPKYLVSEKIEIVIQVNGKLRDKILVSADISDDEMTQKALTSEKSKSFVEGKSIVKTIVISKKLVNIVVK
jgi:leucyl-tRNA synthetase